MKPTDLAYLDIPSSPTLSPDGQRAVVAVTRTDLEADAYRGQLWLVRTDGSTPPRPITYGWRDGGPRFSPDGHWLAFLRATRDAPPQLHVMAADGGEPFAATTAEQHPLGVADPAWSPDSRRLAYTARVPEEGRYGTADGVDAGKEPPRRVTSLNYRLDGIGFLTDRRPQVFVVDPFAGARAGDAGTPVRVTAGDYDHGDVTWSPDGTLLAFVAARHEARDTTMTNDVFACAPDGSGLRQVTRTDLAAGQPHFSPGGDTIYFAAEELGTDGRDFVARTAGIWEVPADGSAAPVRHTEEERYGLATHPVLPLLPFHDDVLGCFENRGAVELTSVPRDGGEPQPLLDGPRQVTGYDSVTGYGGTAGVVVATVTDPHTPGELVALRDGHEHTVTSFGSPLSERGIRPMHEVETSAPDGYPVHGWVVRPNGDGPYPVLLLIHGGPFAQFGWRLFDEAQVYADAGYAVVMGNPRGSSGYGRAHGLAVRHDVGAVSEADLIALLDYALEAPDLDSGRVGVLGGSHGGFMTTWLLGRTDRFRAGITERAVNAIDSFTGSSDVGWVFSDAYYGSTQEAHAAQSPLTHAGDITAPTLIIHSEQDWRCPFEQAQRLFVALKKQGVETEMLVFPGEGHEMSRSGLPSHRVARFDAILDWWHRHL